MSRENVEAVRRTYETFVERHEPPWEIFTDRFFHVFTFRDGKIARWSTHTERRNAVEAAGLAG